MDSNSIGDVARVLAPWGFCSGPSKETQRKQDCGWMPWVPAAVDAKEEGGVWMHKRYVRRALLWTCMMAVVLGLGLAETAHAQKIGVVDLQAVLDQSTRGRAAKDRLRELGDRLQ